MLLRSSTSIVYMQNNYIVYSTDYLGANLDSLFKQHFIKFNHYSNRIKQTRKNMISTFLKNKMK